MKKSMLTVAYDILTSRENPISFTELFEAVSQELEFTPEEKQNKIALFYTNLSLDGRFVLLADNTWDLCKRVSWKKRHIDMTEAYSDNYSSSEEDNDDSSDVNDEDKQTELGEGSGEEEAFDKPSYEEDNTDAE